MNLNQAKLNTFCKVKKINISDEKLKTRIMELGLIEGTQLAVKSKSLGKQTLLVSFNSSCFTLKQSVAEGIEVIYG